MPRRKKFRWIYFEPEEDEGEIELGADEAEAIRLADVEGLNQLEAAEIMGISQPTFHRILKEARRKAGIAILTGKRVRIVSRDYALRKFKCSSCGNEWTEPFDEKPDKCPKCDFELFWHPGMKRGRRGGRF